MNWLVYHVASGHAFFTGVALVIIAAIASRHSGSIANRITVWAFLFGTIAIITSSTAISYCYYSVTLLATVAWALSRYIKKWRRWAPNAVITAWTVAAVIESSYHITPTLKPASPRSITIIGDSLTAGIGTNGKSEKWPTLLAKEHDLTVQDISHIGETAASALNRAKQQQIVSSVVLIEIGGNDLLGSTSSPIFLRDLDALLAHVSSPGRQIIMFELPLPPFNYEYGRIQRSLAHKHNVLLVPKRIILSIIAPSDSTLDTIHLSQSGHNRMATCVWRLVKPAFPAK